MMENTPLLITCGIGQTWRELNEALELLNPTPKVVIIDYIQGIARRVNESREQMNEYIRYFRQICVERDIVGILCSQISRQALDGRRNEPTLNTLKETGVLEEHSDLVFLLHWEHFYTYKDEDKNAFRVIVAKNRNGRCGEVSCFFYPEYYLFCEEEII